MYKRQLLGCVTPVKEQGGNIARTAPLYAGWDLDLPGAQPVSYTHLRAHETVLDLVCRLLLEKNNNNTTHTHTTTQHSNTSCH